MKKVAMKRLRVFRLSLVNVVDNNIRGILGNWYAEKPINEEEFINTLTREDMNYFKYLDNATNIRLDYYDVDVPCAYKSREDLLTIAKNVINLHHEGTVTIVDNRITIYTNE